MVGAVVRWAGAGKWKMRTGGQHEYGFGLNPTDQCFSKCVWYVNPCFRIPGNTEVQIPEPQS